MFVALWYSPTLRFIETPWKFESVNIVQQQSPSIFNEAISLSNVISLKSLTSPVISTELPLKYVCSYMVILQNPNVVVDGACVVVVVVGDVGEGRRGRLRFLFRLLAPFDADDFE